MDGQYLRDEQGKIVYDRDDQPVPIEFTIRPWDKGEGSPIARPLVRRPIGGGNPGGFWTNIKAWWTGLKPEYRYGIFGGLAAIGVIIAAVQGKGKGSSVKKI